MTPVEQYEAGFTSPSRRRGPECKSDLALDRFGLGELDGAEVEQVRAHLAACEVCAARATQLSATAEAFDRENNVGALAAAALARASSPPEAGRWLAGLRRWAMPLGAVGAVGVLAVWVLAKQPAGLEETNLKGAAGFGLSAYVKHVEFDGLGTAWQGEPLHPGDRMLFRYSGSRAGYITVIGIDARSVVSVYYPVGPQAARVDSGFDVQLAGGVELDETLGVERIVAVRCDTPIATAQVVKAAQQVVSAAQRNGQSPTSAGAPELPNCSVASLDIQKTALPAGR